MHGLLMLLTAAWFLLPAVLFLLVPSGSSSFLLVPPVSSWFLLLTVRSSLCLCHCSSCLSPVPFVLLPFFIIPVLDQVSVQILVLVPVLD